jgi:hypothetical protein
MNNLKIILVCAVFTLIVNSCAQSTSKTNSTVEQQKTEKGVYTCEMHPEVLSDKPGNCPKCGMTLIKKEVKAEADSAKSGK